jgi:hypothetical protein
MNANELADDLDYACAIAEPRIEMMKRMKLCAAMLRQQQAEIETLKLQLHTTLTNRDLRTYDGKTEINNEPLAWALRKAQEK